MNNDSLVSIIMPAYNSQKYIFDAINSVVQQTYQNWELIVVDDCSTDDTAFIIKEFARKDSRIKPIFNDKNSGTPAKAKNIALKYTQGDFIAFLDSDDIWINTKLQLQIDLMVKNTNFYLCYTGGYIIDEKSNIIRSFLPNYKFGFLLEDMLKQYEINNQSVLIRKECLNIKENFNEDIVIGEDYNFFMNIVANFECCNIKEKLIKYRKHNSSISKNIQYIYQGTEKTIDELERDFFHKYQNSFKYARAKIAFYKAKYYISKNISKNASNELSKYKFVSLKYFIIFILTYFPNIFKKLFL
jgi:glycosyltransferase involved in cell wall biosynthesis